jgi:hypothetical protein
LSNIKVTQEQIDAIIAGSDIRPYKFGDKTTVLHVVLPSGFIIFESSSCVDPANFDEVIGYEICMERVINKVWELEGYALQKKVSEEQRGTLN